MMTYKVIASRLGLPESTVSHICRENKVKSLQVTKLKQAVKQLEMQLENFLISD